MDLNSYHWRPPLYSGILSPGYRYDTFNPFSVDSSNQNRIAGLVRTGVPLSVDTVLEAYAKGIFPWYENPPVKWYSPPHRLVLFPSHFKVSSSFKKFLRHTRNNRIYHVTFDSNVRVFRQVVMECAEVKRRYFETTGAGTWITDEIKNVYTELFTLGVAHSVEVWNRERELVGGLYGLGIGKMFFGESMFHHETNCSKLALYDLCLALEEANYLAIDCQVYSEHLESLGGVLIDKISFLQLLKKSQTMGESSFGNWGNLKVKN